MNKEQFTQNYMDHINNSCSQISRTSIEKFAYQNETKHSFISFYYKNYEKSIITEYIESIFNKMNHNTEEFGGFRNKVKRYYSILLSEFYKKPVLLRKIVLYCLKNPIYGTKTLYSISSFIMSQAGADVSFSYYTKRASLFVILIKSCTDIIKNVDFEQNIANFNSRIDNFVNFVSKVKK